MKKLIVLLAVLTLAGCSTPQGKGAAIGGASGAILGGVIGNATGGSGVVGAGIGAAAGAVTGAVIADQMTTKFCPECGRQYTSETEFCPIDGTQLKVMEK